MAIIKAGIVLDDYKLELFEKELKKNGFDDYSISPFVKGTSVIRVFIEQQKLKEFEKLCKRTELHYKSGN